MYQRAIHIKGKIYWTGVRPTEDNDLVHFIMCYNTGVKNISTCDIELIDDGFPEYITVVNNKIGVVFRHLISDQRVLMNLWVSRTDDLADFRLVHYIKVDNLDQEHDVIGFEEDGMVLSDRRSRNAGSERDIMFCYRRRCFTKTIQGTLPNYSYVKYFAMFQFSKVRF